MKKMEWDDNDVFVIDNKELVCKDCDFIGFSTATCIAYSDGKPRDVLTGGKCNKRRIKDIHEPA